MNEFKTILTRLKEILTNKDRPDTKIRDKDIAAALKIKSSALASYKRRDKVPYQAILTYCHNNRLDVRKVLFDEDNSIVLYPTPVEDGKVQVRYFLSLKAYSHYLAKLKNHS